MSEVKGGARQETSNFGGEVAQKHIMGSMQQDFTANAADGKRSMQQDFTSNAADASRNTSTDLNNQGGGAPLPKEEQPVTKLPDGTIFWGLTPMQAGLGALGVVAVIMGAYYGYKHFNK